MARDQREVLTKASLMPRLLRKLRLELIYFLAPFLVIFPILLPLVLSLLRYDDPTSIYCILSFGILFLIYVFCLISSIIDYCRVKALKFILVEDVLYDPSRDVSQTPSYLKNLRRYHNRGSKGRFYYYGELPGKMLAPSSASPGDHFILAVLERKWFPKILGFYAVTGYRADALDTPKYPPVKWRHFGA